MAAHHELRKMNTMAIAIWADTRGAPSGLGPSPKTTRLLAHLRQKTSYL